MCRYATIEFDDASQSASVSRHFVANYLRRWELSELSVEVATLLTSELATNAIVHGEGVRALVVAVADGVLEVGVTDHGRFTGPLRPGRNQSRAKTEFASEHGRGLKLVDSFASAWGTARLSGGKQVWFRLAASDWSYRSACRCHGDNIDRVRLESGRYALAISGPWDTLSPGVES